MTTPAETVIEICGGIAAVARMTDRSQVRVRRWTYPRERGGTDGLIPADCQLRLLQGAHALGVPLRPHHFFPPELIAALSDTHCPEPGSQSGEISRDLQGNEVADG